LYSPVGSTILGRGLRFLIASSAQQYAVGYLQQTAQNVGAGDASSRHERRFVARLEVERGTVETEEDEAALVNAGAALEQKAN